MKLFDCPNCGDRVVLQMWDKKCKCGLCYGRYLKDERTTLVTPNAIVLGIPNDQILPANLFVERRHYVMTQIIEDEFEIIIKAWEESGEKMSKLRRRILLTNILKKVEVSK